MYVFNENTQNIIFHIGIFRTIQNQYKACIVKDMASIETLLRVFQSYPRIQISHEAEFNMDILYYIYIHSFTSSYQTAI